MPTITDEHREAIVLGKIEARRLAAEEEREYRTPAPNPDRTIAESYRDYPRRLLPRQVQLVAGGGINARQRRYFERAREPVWCVAYGEIALHHPPRTSRWDCECRKGWDYTHIPTGLRVGWWDEKARGKCGKLDAETTLRLLGTQFPWHLIRAWRPYWDHGSARWRELVEALEPAFFEFCEEHGLIPNIGRVR